MTQSEKNLRVKRTQKLLREALIDLIEERNFDTVTIGEITEHAMVSRAAFYRNYKDKYDLVEQIFEEEMSRLLNAIAEMRQEHPPQVWIKFFEHIAEYERLYRALLGRKGSSWFVMRMRASLADLVKKHGRVSNEPKAATHSITPFSDEFVPDLVSTMLVEAITWWLEHERPYTPKDMATRCALLVAALFKEASTWQ
jgi:AcrR family transcriptional regulator